MMAIVLSRRDFRENDQMIVLYTLEKGKIEALAKGIKKTVSKNAAFLEPFFFV
jgi:DNA repair protein RecO (recombination protein O)